MTQKKKPIVAIIKASSWKQYALFKNHPEYKAIFNFIGRHTNLNFVLIGTSKSSLSGYYVKDNVIAWDIPIPKRIIDYLLIQLHYFLIFLKYRPVIIIPMGLGNVFPSLVFSFFHPTTKIAPIFIGEFGYHGRKIMGKLFNCALLKFLSLALRVPKTNMPNIFAISKFERTCVEKLAPNLKGKIALVSYPISSLFYVASQKRNKKCRAQTILTIAGIEPRKGLDVLVKAVSFITPDTRPRVVIKGQIRDHAYMQQLSRLVSKLGLAEWIKFDHSVTDYDALYQYYQAATLFVLPTLDESLGVVVLEALHSGLPVIATSVGGIPDMIQDGINGVLIEPGNPQKLAKAISWLLKDAPSREALARNAVSTLKRHYYSNRITMEDAFEKIWQNL